MSLALSAGRLFVFLVEMDRQRWYNDCKFHFKVWHLTAAFILQAPSYALYMAAIVPFVKETIDFQDSAKAQSLAFTTTTLGGMLASLIGGQLYDCLSVTLTLWIAFAVGAAGAVVMFLGTRMPSNS